MKSIIKNLATTLLGFIISFSMISIQEIDMARASTNNLSAFLESDKTGYYASELVEVQVKFRDVHSGQKINSATFEIEFNSALFELATRNIENDVVDGYIQFANKSIIEKDKTAKIVLLFASYSDISLREDEPAFTVYLRVKNSYLFGKTSITILPCDMFDSQNNYYNVNDDKPVSIELELLLPWHYNMSPVTNKGVRFINENGQDISELLPFQKVNVLAKMKNNTTQTQTGVLVAVLFDDDNKLKCIGLSNCSIPFGEEEEVRTEIILPEHVQGCTIKVMLWDSFLSMRPLCREGGILAVFSETQ